MDAQDLFYVVIFVIWLLSQVASLVKKAPKPQAPPVPGPKAAPRPATPAALERQARGMLESLARLEARIEDGLPDLDARVRAQTLYLVERDLRAEARRERESIERALAEKNANALSEANRSLHRLVSFYDETLKTARTLSSWRRHPETARATRVADALLEEIDRPFRSFAETALVELAEGPPVAIVRDASPDDTFRSSPLASSTFFIPRSTDFDPTHWSLVAHEVSRYLMAAAPGLYQEIYDRLRLRVTDAELQSSREALTRLLFASFLVRILGDAVGACLFGPSYLRALARLYAEPGPGSRVTTLFLNRDGTVYPEPPAHLRVHLTAEWLTQAGLGSDAAPVLQEWDEKHGYPAFFAFHGSMGTLPADTILGTATNLMAELEVLEIQSLGVRTLSSLPGLSDWSLRHRAWLEAKKSFLAGESASGSPRALVAAAIDACLEAPASAPAIRDALYRSFAAPAALKERARDTVALARAAAPTRALGPHEVAEALILGEILLAPRHRRRKRTVSYTPA
jgi:hypothetical protein